MGRWAASFDRSAQGEQTWEMGPAGLVLIPPSSSSSSFPLCPEFPSCPRPPGGCREASSRLTHQPQTDGSRSKGLPVPVTSAGAHPLDSVCTSPALNTIFWTNSQVNK